jgi:hypothetical protein
LMNSILVYMKIKCIVLQKVVRLKENDKTVESIN